MIILGKLTASFSYRVPTLRYSLSHPTHRSMALRRRYAARSKAQGRPVRGYLVFFWGMTALIRCARSHVRMRGQSYPLSPTTWRGRLPDRPRGRRIVTRSMSCSKKSDSWRCPALTRTCSASPCPSHTRWTFEPKPPRERPKAWSSGSPSRESAMRIRLRVRLANSPSSFFPPGGCSACPHRTAVHKPLIPVNLPVGVQLRLQRPQQPFPEPLFPPPTETSIHRLPRPVAPRHIAPRSTRMQNPENPIHHLSVILPLTTTMPIPRKVVLDQRPLLRAQLIALHHLTPRTS